jgi:hypothetical protein
MGNELTEKQKASCKQTIKECFVFFTKTKLNNRYYKCKYDVEDIKRFFDDNWEEQQEHMKYVTGKFGWSFERTGAIQDLLVQKYMALGEYENTDEVNEKPEPYIPTDEELDAMTLKEAIPYLREKEKRTEQFPWALVERWIKEQDKAVKWGRKPDDLVNTDKWTWYWVDDMANLSGIGGWLQVDVVNKQQGEFKFCAIS